MATGHVKVYEEGKRGGIPVWAWLIPLLLILAILAWFLTHRRPADVASTAPNAVAAGAPTTGMPDLGSVHFATDQATLTPDSQATLQRAAEYMKQHPEIHLRLEGYTDATGTDPHNLTLSQRRTAAVADFLKAQGIPDSRLTGEGFGPEHPVAPNSTPDGKADNRRVELFQQP